MVRALLRMGAVLASLTLLSVPAVAQTQSSVAGSYEGTLGPLHLKLHLHESDGALTGMLDSVDQGALGLPLGDMRAEGKNLSFTVPSVHGSWTGRVSDNGSSLDGTWTQGQPMPLRFTRNTYVPAGKASRVDGTWLGSLHAGPQTLRLQLHLQSDADGREQCTLDSLDQHAFGIPCADAVLSENQFRFDVPPVHGAWSGKLSTDDTTLSGTWSQGGADLPLTLTKQAKALQAASVALDPALPATGVKGLGSVLDTDLAKQLAGGMLAPRTGVGAVVGVVEGGERRVLVYGAGKPDSLFEIGSITKTFTGLILAQMVAQGSVRYDEPVRELLPPKTAAKPASGPEITLVELATHNSGLPRMPDNFNPANPDNPYADYGPPNLYAFVAKHGVARPASPEFGYSNLGMGLLGQALADRAAMDYPELLSREITGPLRMTDTVVRLSPGQTARFAAAHGPNGEPAHAWDLDAMAGAGAIRSTAGDMLAYLEAQLRPERVEASGDAGKTLGGAIRASQQARSDAGPGMRIALNWFYDPATGVYWHNGATGGYSSYACFSPKGGFAVVVLVNRTIAANGSFADLLGAHVRARLEGKPAVSLNQ